jgi:hypothetical protein
MALRVWEGVMAFLLLLALPTFLLEPGHDLVPLVVLVSAFAIIKAIERHGLTVKAAEPDREPERKVV